MYFNVHPSCIMTQRSEGNRDDAEDISENIGR